ncbi:dTMP kinase [Gulosibacter chungangensis]|uniref:Thymidylate kinase n=1 Tax=Gulosibacter chungangensis TaxID=979746 RepID=A0A7J5BG04_9MICO|nr:dTMP kinase [Gulosibacter chungangensis]KAB1644822.1 dTMP kinase [Gulosibacter chungangensis]
MGTVTTRGLFITFEGGDGAGKSTQVALLTEYLRGRELEVLHTREPGGTDLGLALREVLLHSENEIVPRAEALIYAADRANNIATRVRPALERGAIVLQDRYLDSSVAYQGSGRDLGAEEIRDLSLWATEGLLPDVSVLLDIDPVSGRERVAAQRGGLDRLEAESRDFHERVRAKFLELAAAEPSRFLVVDASLAPEAIAELVQARVDAALAAREVGA